MLADAHISSLGYLRDYWLLLDFVRKMKTSFVSSPDNVSSRHSLTVLIDQKSIKPGLNNMADRIAENNSHFLLKKLWSLGIKLGKVAIISDDVDEVITTGGIEHTMMS